MHLQDIQSLVEIIFLHRCLNCSNDESTSVTKIFFNEFTEIYSLKAPGINGHEEWNIEEEEDYHQDQHIYTVLHSSKVDC